MLVAAMAAAAAAATPVSDLPAPKVVSPLTVTAQPKEAPPADATIELKSDDDGPGSQWVSVWPEGAWNARANGQVTLTCFVDIHGLAERCRVAYESPQGKGFGAAALELQPTLKITPRKGPDGQPVAGLMNIALRFKAPEAETNLSDLASTSGLPSAGINAANLMLSHNPIEMRHVVMMNHPVWVAAPSFDDVAGAYPARGGGVEGYAVAHCEVLRSGDLTRCIVSKESPTRHDFAQAALKLARKFKVSPEVMKYAPHGAPIEVDIPIRFAPPAELAQRTVSAPSWISVVDPDTAPKLFPPEAAAKGLTSGRGVAKCVVVADGRLEDCAPEPADPDGLGFSEAAVKLASTMRMNLWSADAEPVQGGVVHVAIRLNLEGSGAP
jgi:TonB family protein